MLYVYAIAADLGDVADLRGVQGETLTLVPFGAAVVVAGRIRAKPPLDAPTLKAQDAVVRGLHDRAGALLPMRFGMAARSADALRKSLERLDDLGGKLENVRGCDQMVVRVFGVRERIEPGPSFGSGRQYLEARARMRTASPELFAIAGTVGSWRRDVRTDPANQQGLHGSVYHLIERGRWDDYRAAINRVAAGLPNVRITISGPSPAYAFA